MIEFLPLFPCPVIKIDTKPEFNNIRNDLISFCYSERENTPKGITRSNKVVGILTYYLRKKNFISIKSS